MKINLTNTKKCALGLRGVKCLEGCPEEEVLKHRREQHITRRRATAAVVGTAPTASTPLSLAITSAKPAQPEPGTQLISKAKLIVTLNERPGILLERFPRHVDNLLLAIARMKTQGDVGISLAEFRENAGRVLRAPGGGIS